MNTQSSRLVVWAPYYMIALIEKIGVVTLKYLRRRWQ